MDDKLTVDRQAILTLFNGIDHILGALASGVSVHDWTSLQDSWIQQTAPLLKELTTVHDEQESK